MLALLCSVMRDCDSPVQTRSSKWNNLFSSHLVDSTNKMNKLTQFTVYKAFSSNPGKYQTLPNWLTSLDHFYLDFQLVNWL